MLEEDSPYVLEEDSPYVLEQESQYPATEPDVASQAESSGSKQKSEASVTSSALIRAAEKGDVGVGELQCLNEWGYGEYQYPSIQK